MATKQTTRNGSTSSTTTDKKRKSEAPPAPQASAAAKPAVPTTIHSDGMRTLTPETAAPEPRSASAKAPPSHDDIALRAFSLYQSRGGGGDAIEDWLTAERELTR